MEGAKVYIQDATGSEWSRANVVSALGNSRYRVQKEAWDDAGGKAAGVDQEPLEVDASKMEGGMLPFQNANMPEFGFANMTTLDHLHEAALLHNLRKRFFAGGCPYTYTADIVIAVNPYRWYPELYTDDVRKEYLVFDKAKLPPHAYATSSVAYSGLQESHVDQAILVSGESGAGKTETVKIMMAHLAMIASSDNSSHITRIVESNPLLEAFGNAQTVRNDNSSRFGKFIELELNSACRLVGSRCRTYLLEKSRVVGQDAGERNYHIFYQMLAATPERRGGFGLTSTAHTRDEMRYTRLGASKIDTIEGKSDAQGLDHTVNALEMVGVQGETLGTLMSALASVLLLGQLDFDKTSDDGSCFSSASAEDAKIAAAALQVESEHLERALTRRTIKTRNESFSKPLSAEAAELSRDAISKELYSRCFDWLVTKICAATGAVDQSDVKHFIGLLDIFGFESFAVNRFSQICINYANEKLQQKFTADVFKTVQQEYAEEGIPWDKIEFKDNAAILFLIESKMGIIAMLNEECIRPKGAEEIFVSKLVSVHRDDPALSVPKVGKLKEFQFTVCHYAGHVTYTTHDWLERNRGTVSDDLLELMRKSGNALIAQIFVAEEANVEGKAKGGAETVATKFKASLTELMATISKTKTQYVRCIKPNKNKSPAEVDNPMVVDQLRCAGVIEAIRISRAGFPARMPLKEFALRFIVLVRAAAGQLGKRLQSLNSIEGGQSQTTAALDSMARGSDVRATCRSLMAALTSADDEKYQIGTTRVYFKSGILEFLEEKRALLMQSAATELVRSVKGWFSRRRYQRTRRAVLKLQANFRRARARAAYQVKRRTAVFCQAHRRGILARRRTHELRRQRAATRLQSWHRMCMALNKFRQTCYAAIRIQARVRCRICRKQYVVNLKEHKEQAKLENQVKALQARLEAAEKAGRSGGGGPSETVAGGEPSAEILQALQALATENQKLRIDLDRYKSENSALRHENQELRAGQSARNDWISVFKGGGAGFGGSKKGASPDPPARKNSYEFPTSPVQLGLDLGLGALKKAAEDEAEGGPRPSAQNVTGGLVLQHYAPLCPFWEDVPVDGIPLLKRGSEVHIKLGPNILMVDEKHKYLVYRPWMDSQNGYYRSMGFFIEKRKERRSSALQMGLGRASSLGLGSLLNVGKADDQSFGPGDDGCIGLAFALRSATTRKYVSTGGMFDKCLNVTADRSQDAAIFTIVPMPSASTDSGAATGGMSDSAYCFALRLLNENKCLSLRRDGYVGTTTVADDDDGIENETTAAAMEYLMPLTAYEITVYEIQIGLTVGKDLPLRVVGFSAVPNVTTGALEPGPAERTGRVRLGDIIRCVNGQDIAGIPRKDVLAMIHCRRPATLGFTTDPSNANFKH